MLDITSQIVPSQSLDGSVATPEVDQASFEDLLSDLKIAKKTTTEESAAGLMLDGKATRRGKVEDDARRPAVDDSGWSSAAALAQGVPLPVVADSPANEPPEDANPVGMGRPAVVSAAVDSTPATAASAAANPVLTESRSTLAPTPKLFDAAGTHFAGAHGLADSKPAMRAASYGSMEGPAVYGGPTPNTAKLNPRPSGEELGVSVEATHFEDSPHSAVSRASEQTFAAHDFAADTAPAVGLATTKTDETLVSSAASLDPQTISDQSTVPQLAVPDPRENIAPTATLGEQMLRLVHEHAVRGRSQVGAAPITAETQGALRSANARGAQGTPERFSNDLTTVPNVLREPKPTGVRREAVEPASTPDHVVVEPAVAAWKSPSPDQRMSFEHPVAEAATATTHAGTEKLTPGASETASLAAPTVPVAVQAEHFLPTAPHADEYAARTRARLVADAGMIDSSGVQTEAIKQPPTLGQIVATLSDADVEVSVSPLRRDRAETSPRLDDATLVGGNVVSVPLEASILTPPVTVAKFVDAAPLVADQPPGAVSSAALPAEPASSAAPVVDAEGVAAKVDVTSGGAALHAPFASMASHVEKRGAAMHLAKVVGANFLARSVRATGAKENSPGRERTTEKPQSHDVKAASTPVSAPSSDDTNQVPQQDYEPITTVPAAPAVAAAALPVAAPMPHHTVAPATAVDTTLPKAGEGRTALTASDVTTAKALPAVQTAKLIHGIGQTEMRVGMRTAEFGNVSIHTSSSAGTMATQISVEHGELAKALTAHIPEMQTQMGAGARSSVQVDFTAQGAGTQMTGGDGRGSSAHGQPNESQGERQALRHGMTYFSRGSLDGPLSAMLPVGDGRASARLDVRV